MNILILAICIIAAVIVLFLAFKLPKSPCQKHYYQKGFKKCDKCGWEGKYEGRD